MENRRHVFEPRERSGARRPRVAEMLYALGRLDRRPARAGIGTTQIGPLCRSRSGCAHRARRPRSRYGPAIRNIQEIVERSICALINEGAQILEESSARRASDIDLVYIHGYAFPAHRGGPMHYADEVGPRRVYERALDFGWNPLRYFSALGNRTAHFQPGTGGACGRGRRPRMLMPIMLSTSSFL
jgi:hypothetical protein